MGVVMNWKVKTKNMDNEIRILYLDANNKDEVRKEVQDEYIISIKRNYEIKDFSNILPGHGGFADRVDSLCVNSITLSLVLSLMLIL